MRKIYVQDEIRFVELTEQEVKELHEITPERVWISKENVDKISDILKIKEVPTDELQPLRNSIVKLLCDDYVSEDDWTRMSMITCVIDNEVYSRNGGRW